MLFDWGEVMKGMKVADKQRSGFFVESFCLGIGADWGEQVLGIWSSGVNCED
jgi:hypothetical protein